MQYANTVSFDYAWDDKLAITANDYTKKGIKGLPEIFTKRVSIPFKSEYRPIPQAMHAIEYDLFGGSPHAGHAFNVLWYAIASGLVYVFVRFTFFRLHPLFAFLGAVLFVVHPLHVEVVANIKGRDEILALIFALSSIMLLVQALEKGSCLRLIAGSAFFVAACLSKSNAVTMLPVVVLVAWFRSDNVRISRRLAVAIGTVAVCSVATVALIRHFQNTVSDDTTLHLNSTLLNNIFLWTTHSETIVPTALVIIGRYALLFVYPHPLLHLYGYDQIPLNWWSDLITWLVIVALVAVGAIVVKTWPRKLPFAFGVLFFVITYSVYSNLFFYAPDTMADRYMFTPSIGLAIVAVYGVFRLAGMHAEAPTLNTGRSKAVVSLFSVVLAIFFVRTFAGNRDWENDSTLIYNRIQYMQDNAAAQAIYGHTLNKEGNDLASPQMKRERKAAAMRAFTQAIRIYPDFQAAWIAIGQLFAERGIYDKAELSFLKAQRLEPLNPDSYFCMGTLYFAQQDLDLAIPYLEKAVLLDPKMEEAYVMLAKAYLRANNVDNLGAITAAARNSFPNSVALEALRATYYFRKQQWDQAFVLAKLVTARDPQNILALTILSSPLAQDISKK